jgi:hypothetical protein
MLESNGIGGPDYLGRLIQSQVTDFRDSSLVVSTKPTDFCPESYRVWCPSQAWSGGHERVT